MKLFICVLAVGFGIAFLNDPDARAQGTDATNTANAFTNGPLGNLDEAAAKMGFKDTMPAKLCGLLWPGASAPKGTCKVKKVAVEGKDETEKRIMIVRMDNHDLIFAHFTETAPHDNAKTRREYYFRPTPAGDLALALKVTFQFRISDTDTDLLEGMTYETYDDAGGKGEDALPVTPEIKAKFETEKKLWLAQEKQLKKKERAMDKMDK
jgi:hypothetical protein